MDIFSNTPTEIKLLLCENRLKETAADNVFKDIYVNGAESYEEMTSCSKEVRRVLSERFEFEQLVLEELAEDENTAKYLFALSDGNLIETVLMKQEYGNAVCVSSQCGCNMGCKFCCSGKSGKVRDLTAGEMVRQILFIEKDRNIKITNVTVMGIGEPLDNFEELARFIEIITYGRGMAIGSAHVTVSTCGLADRIEQLGFIEGSCNLAISLHAADDETRSRIMPINKKYPLSVLIPVVKSFAKENNKRVFIEYIMLKGINDSRDDAKKLAALLCDETVKLPVNLIPYNSGSGEFQRSDEQTVNGFYDELKKNGITVTRRREFGSGINAACGQLRINRTKETKIEIQL